MKTLIVIETAKELLKFACKVRAKGDDTPILPEGATLVFKNELQSVRLEQCQGFVLSDDIMAEDIIEELVHAAFLKIHIT